MDTFFKSFAALLIVTTIITSQSLAPFKALAACTSPIAPSPTIAQDVVSQAYTSWKTTYVVPATTTSLRVKRSANDNYDTVSEGIAYGMLFAAYLNDKPTFDGLWNYARQNLDSNGLMHWRIDANGNTSGWNSATDADLDMAAALIAADTRWGGYSEVTKTLINKIMVADVEAGSFVLKPGDSWGGTMVTNPSYFSPAYYPLFKAITGDARWDLVLAKGYASLKDLDWNTATGKTGLVPDWSTSYGTPAAGMGFSYGYDAVRAPLRFAQSSMWQCDTLAKNRMTKMSNTFARIGITNVVDGYNLDATPYGQLHSGMAVGAAAVSALGSSDSTFQTSSWNELVATTGGGYYDESIRLFSLLIAGGLMPTPTSLSQSEIPVVSPTPTPIPSPTTIPTPSPTPTPTTIPTPTPDPTPTTIPAPSPSPMPTPTTNPIVTRKISIWWPSNGSTVIGTQPFKVLLEGSEISTYQMYWQVDGGTLNLMRNDLTDYPHKQVDVDVSGWKWRGTGPYVLTFTAKNSLGMVISTTNSSITIR